MPKYADLSVGHIRDYVPVTPNDSTDNLKANTTDVVVGFYIGGAGNLVVTIDGTNRTIPVVANQFLPCTGATRVRSTSTTATNIFACVI